MRGEKVKEKTNKKYPIKEVNEKLLEMFPDIKTANIVTSKQINEFVAKTDCQYPRWLLKYPVSRGKYTFDLSLSTAHLNASKSGNQMKALHSDDLPVPMRDPNYVQFGIHQHLNTVIGAGRFFPVFITGPTGNGKSTTVEQLCSNHNRPLIRVNINAVMDEEYLIGSKTLIDGTVYVVEGPVLIAMRKGYILLLDELDAASANAILCLQGVLEGKPYYFKSTNEWIVPSPGFNVIATANTKGKGSDDGRYIGTNVLNEAFLERFAVVLEQGYPPEKQELLIMKNIMKSLNCYDEAIAAALVKWATVSRKTFEEGAIQDVITTRRLIHIVNAYSMFDNITLSVDMALSRFDSVTKTALLDFFKKVYVPNKQEHYSDEYGDPINPK